MRLDRLLTSAAAVSRVSSSIAAGVRIDATTWDTVITTLVRMNNRCREHLAGDQYVRYLLQLDVTERLLAQYVAQDNRPRKKRANQGLGAAQAQGTALIEVALALSVDDPLLATQLLVGVALRALAAISVGMPRRRRGR